MKFSDLCELLPVNHNVRLILRNGESICGTANVLFLFLSDNCLSAKVDNIEAEGELELNVWINV